MMQSIRAELAIYLAIAIICVIGLLAGLSYYSTSTEMGELYDANLKQVASAIVESYSQQHPSAETDLPLKAKIRREEDYFIKVLHGREAIYQSHQWLFDADISHTGFSIQRLHQTRWRMYIVKHETWTVIVAQDYQLRQDTIRDTAITLIIPQLLVVPFLVVVTLLIIRKTFSPLLAVSTAIQARSPEDLQPLKIEHMPREIRPIIQALNQWMHKVANTLILQKRFTSDAAHELRTPVTALKLQIGAMAQAGKDELKQLVQLANTGVARMERLVQQLLTLARVDPDAMPQARQSIHLNSLVIKVLNDLKTIYQEKQLDIGFTHVDEVHVTGAPDDIEMLLNNLLINAIHYTPFAGMINLKLIQQPDVVIFEVEDSGPGIPEAEMDKVFERFYRSPHASASGSGLGLAIVREVAQGHGAEVRLSNRPNSGLVVTVRFKQQGR